MIRPGHNDTNLWSAGTITRESIEFESTSLVSPSQFHNRDMQDLQNKDQAWRQIITFIEKQVNFSYQISPPLVLFQANTELLPGKRRMTDRQSSFTSHTTTWLKKFGSILIWTLEILTQEGKEKKITPNSTWNITLHWLE